MLAISVREAHPRRGGRLRSRRSGHVRQSGHARAGLLRRPARPRLDGRSPMSAPELFRAPLASHPRRILPRTRRRSSGTPTGACSIRDGRIVASGDFADVRAIAPDRGGHGLARWPAAARLRRCARALPAAADHRRVRPDAARLAGPLPRCPTRRAWRDARLRHGHRTALRRRARRPWHHHRAGVRCALRLGNGSTLRGGLRAPACARQRPGGVRSLAASGAASIGGRGLSRLP